MEEVKYYSQEGLDALKKELSQLESVERPKISQAIAEARDKGDLSENAEYDAAKEAQGLLEMKIANLRNLIATARVLDESKIDVSKVLIYSIVKIKNVKNGMTMTYTIVPESESDFKAGKISVSSPIAKALIGNSKGDVVTVQAPVGTMEFEILDISR
ncbi:MAG: transcription elongation factor GreA [Bacteroidales bacterium]|nr:transcription elongation factor GreA [Bacteroidales bacterium]MBO7647684.1 transcription elongation factor GreA [Bacteroidales bacterium]MCR4858890.1 transcription elongation factor GreA [Bacteroidales bacterium]